jgi:polyisoprenoid-binding protein YceI
VRFSFGAYPSGTVSGPNSRSIKAQLNGDAFALDAEFKINRKDFGIVYAGRADNLIKDDVVIKLAIKAKKG